MALDHPSRMPFGFLAAKLMKVLKLVQNDANGNRPLRCQRLQCFQNLSRPLALFLIRGFRNRRLDANRRKLRCASLSASSTSSALRPGIPFPTADVATMLREIERGHVVDGP